MDISPTETGIPCACRRWHHRGVRGLAASGAHSLPPGFFVYWAVQSQCPVCAAAAQRHGLGRFRASGQYLILFRIEWSPRRTDAIGIAPLVSSAEIDIRLALHEIKPDLLAEEVDQIVGVFECSVQPDPPTSPPLRMVA